MTTPRFLSYVRRGLAAGAPDALSGPLPNNPAVRASVQLSDSNGAVTTSTRETPMVGPGDVSGIDAAQVIRYEPPAGTNDFETNYLPFVELVAPDLPWLLTPASPADSAALRPWLVLVVVEESESVRFADAGHGGVLSIDADQVAVQLWDLADSHVWAHAQTTAADSSEAVTNGTGQVIARLMCPRKLRIATRYRAALVPAFDAGVAAGLGVGSSAADLTPAWDLESPADLELPTYVSWTFSTSEEGGDFESLARRLQPDVDGGRLGFRRTRLETGGLLPPADPDLGFEFEFAGALTDPGGAARPLPRDTQRWLDNELRAAVERGRDRVDAGQQDPASYDPERDDPVLAPPLYGQWAANVNQIPKSGWVHEVNLDVAQRAAAGVGAEIVRQNEHDFLSSAWDQVGALREAKVELNRTRLVGEVADRQLDKLSRLDDATLIFAVGSITSKVAVSDDGRSVRSAVRRSPTVPSAVVSAAFYRAARSGGVVGKAYRSEAARPVSRRVANRFVAAAGAVRPAGNAGAVIAFKKTFVPDGTMVAGVTPAGGNESDPVSDAAVAIRSVKPLTVALDRLAERIDGVGRLDLKQRAGGSSLVPASGGSIRIVSGPWFPDGLAPKLQAMSPELLLPGVGEFARDRVRLLEINEGFVAALLVGANHEWAREALWREFPADLDATAFASLFDRPGDPPAPGPDTDLNAELAGVPLEQRLSDMVGGSGTGTVLLMRAELVRRFPGLVVSLLRPSNGGVPMSATGELMAEHVIAPMFLGHIDPSTIFVGFDVDPSVVLGEEWYLSVEEPPSGPRFGFDAGGGSGIDVHDGGPQDAPESWADLTWAHLRSADPSATHIRLSAVGWNGTERAGVEWGRNGAHQARLAFQQPYRMIFPAHALIGARR